MRPLSNNTANAALQAMGYNTQTEHTMHGWRSTASTLLSHLGWDEEAREAQLAHVKGDVAGRYNKYKFMDLRRPMMQAYADYLDELRDTLEAEPAARVTRASLRRHCARSCSSATPSRPQPARRGWRSALRTGKVSLEHSAKPL